LEKRMSREDGRNSRSWRRRIVVSSKEDFHKIRQKNSEKWGDAQGRKRGITTRRNSKGELSRPGTRELL